MKTLRDYIRIFIKKKYLTNDTKKIKILLNSTEYIDVEPVIVNKNNFSLLSKIKNLLDLPVLKIKVLHDNKLSEIDLEETVDVLSGKIKINIRPCLHELGDDFILCFDCILLSKIYTDSFLYKLDILKPMLYSAIKEYGNTVISYTKYKRAMEYIDEHRDKLSKQYNITSESNHNLLEKIYGRILELNNDSFIIRYVDDRISPYYIIETVSKHSQTSMSKN